MRKQDKIQKIKEARALWLATLEYHGCFDYWLDMEDVIELMLCCVPDGTYSKHYLKHIFWKEMYNKSPAFQKWITEREY